ncbi:type I restriction endonuclease [Clostridium perfringens]|uniref:type I restriction endonuclease n=1 Tax=Clostridium perfringens TaxID=1502 RepID=UPI0018E450A1|nr:type I restriction endonuclease subunit R [Clostridium perfringens]
MIHTEDSRVKIPALLHFRRLGYTYQSKKGANIDSSSNIFIDVFAESIRNINNNEYSQDTINSLIKEISNLIDNDIDKGKSFYERLVGYNKVRLIDLKNPANNDFRVVTELTFKGDRNEFRPDITILINGIPLGFIEVKKPNNHNGIQDEFKRMKKRMRYKDCNHFFNMFQVLGFTNNQPYNDEERIKLQGSFYTTPNGDGTTYNLFREEQEIPVNEYLEDDFIDYVLNDNNIQAIKSTQEFNTNLKIDTPCNKFITSVFSKERLIFFIRYGIAFVDSQTHGLNKHIIRYPQYFAIQELTKRIGNGLNKGIVWHTQGSGKTALSYFITNVLRDYYQERGIITKFYFVVDRLDLLIQASGEFASRGMTIASINSKEDFVKNIKSSAITDIGAQQGKYKETMNVVNIQKFSQDSTVDIKCAKKIQRIYLLDEVHRGYKKKGVFLSNLLGADPNGIYIGLTGTPLLKNDSKSTDLFDDYIHKYYYNKSIADGYTLKIKKENISTKFRKDIRSMLKIKDDGEKVPSKQWELVGKYPIFVDKLCKYIQDDFNTFKELQNDSTLGSMIVTSSSEQARLIQEWFTNNSALKTALVLYDEDDNKEKQEEFRGKKNPDTGQIESKYSGVVVYNMLLTGFDAPRLKRLYLLRQIKDHSLLQTLARVNRPYKDMKYGYIVDFVDITEQYEETNRRYLEELKEDIKGDDDVDITEIFVDPVKVRESIKTIENKLFNYMANIETNLEDFRKQIEPLDEIKLRHIRNCLVEYKECYNELRMSHEDVSNIPIDRLNKAYYEVSNRINLKVAEKSLGNQNNDSDDIDFKDLVVEFLKTGEIDLEFTTENDISERINNIKNALSANCDKEDKIYKELYKRFKTIIKKFKDEADTSEKVALIIVELDALINEIAILNNSNSSLTKRYNGDESCMRIHKKLLDDYSENLTDIDVFNIMNEIITEIDSLICNMAQPTEEVIMRQMLRPVRDAFKKYGYKLSKRQVENIIYLFVDDKFKK